MLRAASRASLNTSNRRSRDDNKWALPTVVNYRISLRTMICNERVGIAVEKSGEKSVRYNITVAQIFVRCFKRRKFICMYCKSNILVFIKKKIFRAFSVCHELYTAIFFSVSREYIDPINFHSSNFIREYFFFYNEIIKINKTRIFYSFKVLLQFCRITILYSLSKVIFWK